MHPGFGSNVADDTQDEFDGGRNSLRLVKIRLVLTLMVVAILPLAAIAPLARAVLDDTKTALEQRLVAEAEHAATEVRRELTGVRDTLESLAALESVALAIGLPVGDPAAEPAVNQLRKLLERPSGVVAAVAITDPGGALISRVGAEATVFIGTPAPPVDRARFTLLSEEAGRPAILEIAVGIPAEDAAPPVGSIVASVPISGLLAWASPDAAAAGRTVQLVDPGGRVLALIGPSAGINLPGTVLSLATDGSAASEGAASIGLPALGGWRAVATAPLPVTEIPFPALAALFGLIGLLVAFAWWMGRQIIRPAAVLESERDRLHGLYENAREASLADSLTGLGNHRAFQEAVARMVEQSRRYGNMFSLILLDIDEFKQVNDTRGHSVGDDLLAEVGDLIRAVIRGSDAGFRIGGDEFAVLLAETDAGGAAMAARRILSRGLEARGTGRYGASISFSAGVSSCPALGTTRAELTAQADAALYRGKRAGRTVVTVFDPNEDRGHVDEGMRAELSASIAAVIESRRLSPVYQPIVHLPTGRILGYEGLIRVDPASGFPHTGALFDAAEIAGRVLDLDRAALEVVLRGATQLPEQTLLSLNVSPRSFEAPEFNATVFLAILQRHGMAPDRVILELTEREAIRNADRLREAIHTLEGAGVRVAADDVGAGNAGLRLLSQFRFDVVKIDLSLVQGGANQDQTMGVLTSLVGMARRWGALTIAEGVETAEQLRMIRGLEIDAGQGYLLGRPGPITDNADMDLDALAGAIQVGTAKTMTPAVVLSGAQPKASAASSAGRGPVPRARSSGGGGSTEPVLTAAALIASGAPNPFAPR